ncbi:MAG: N-acetylneuraminate synthase family protein, partial [Planctomycetes bacterium]|nr:N-acetylneuraminate synthase family protein [Planctomycetota bacterium]
MSKEININDPFHTFVIAEAGSNWKAGSFEEDMIQAEQLIEVASKAGADAIKFQTFHSESVYAENAGQIDYLKEKSDGKSINEIFSDLSMPYEMLGVLSKLCKKNQIHFMSTPFSVEDVMEVDKFVKIHKIASYENNHVKLLEVIAKT